MSDDEFLDVVTHPDDVENLPDYEVLIAAAGGSAPALAEVRRRQRLGILR
jgi:hypothetical protein